MSILLYNFKELAKSIEEVERIEGRVNTKKKVFTKREEKEERKKVPPNTLDSYFVKANVKWDAASNPLPSLSK